jgi:hypothetical protein
MDVATELLDLRVAMRYCPFNQMRTYAAYISNAAFNADDKVQHAGCRSHHELQQSM